ncbi:MAG: hypothetical protein IPM18_07035 [Phycisphaerales bacterium]|nr:hypothetical protein [Phycisphaerales bacterium]
MWRRKRALTLAEYRAALEREGEIAIGAYARAQRRQRILMGLFGLLLLAGAVFILVMLWPRSDAGTRDLVPVVVDCAAEGCDFRGVVQVRADGEFPVPCPACGQRSGYKMWHCREGGCGAIFVPKAGNGEIRCPRCGSRRVGTATEIPSPPAE